MAPPNSDIAPQQRIINHMNRDHQDSLVRYLEHHHKLSSRAARDAEITYISLDSMTLVASGRRWVIPFDPPMTSFADARLRAVEMDTNALAALGRHPITVREYVPPKGPQIIIFLAVLYGFFAFAYRPQFQPGSILYDLIWSRFPSAAAFLYKFSPIGLTLMILIHGAEAWYMHVSKLTTHSVATGGTLWWIWMTSTFFEGFGAFQRINALIRKKEAANAKRKH